MRFLSIVKYGFPFIGLILLMGGFSLYQQSSRFLETAVSVQGVVVDYETRLSEGKTLYQAIVEFPGEDNQQHRLVSSVASAPPAYEQGDNVEVLHLPGQAQEARINSFFELWGGMTVVLILGAVFLAVGLTMLVAGRLNHRRKIDLRTSGTRVAAEFQTVRCDHRFTINDRKSYVIICQWLNPETQKLHIFKSEKIWFDPTRVINRPTIDVYIQPGNPQKYYVDISFLPQVAA